MNAEAKLESLRKEIEVCRDCPLHQGRVHSVPGEGPANSPIMFIGEGPGFHENQQGKPFVGQAGKFLDELLAQAGLKRTDVFITNVVKCRPPSNRDPQPDELLACGKYLQDQIEAINPGVIVTLGRFSMARFVENGRISQIHGQPHLVDGRTIVTMYHPAAALHQPNLRDQILADFAGLRQWLPNAKTEQMIEVSEEIPQTPQDVDPEQLSLF